MSDERQRRFITLNLLLVWFICVLSSYKCVGKSGFRNKHKPCFKELPDYVMLRHLSVSKQLPICVVYRQKGKGSKLETELCHFWKTRDKLQNYSSWQVGAFAADIPQDKQINLPTKLPTLRCDLGMLRPFDFAGKVTAGRISDWFSRLAARHNDALISASLSSLRIVPPRHNFTLIGFPADGARIQMETMLLEVRDSWRDSVDAMLVHPHSEDGVVITNMFSVTTWPTVIVLDSNGEVESRFEDDVTRDTLDVYLYVKRISALHLTEENFEEEILRYHRQFVPSLVCFYADYAPNVMQYLYAFERAVLDFSGAGFNIKFGLVDLKTQESVLYQSLKGEVQHHIESYPFTVLFHPVKKDNHINIRQTLFPGGHPTPGELHPFLKYHQLVVDSLKRKLAYQPWGVSPVNEITSVREGPFGTSCTPFSHNLTDNNPRPPPTFKRRKKKTKVAKKKKNVHSFNLIDRRLPKLGTVPVVSETTWSEVIEKSHAPVVDPLSLHKEWKGEITKVALVIFVISDCGSCRRNQPVFEELYSAVQFIKGGAAYMVNCTSDPRLCKENDVTGFPTLSAFRGVGWLESDNCISKETIQAVRYVRLDYHGVILTNPIMEWFSKVSSSAVSDLGQEELYHFSMAEDVYLLGQLTPKSSNYLPRMSSSIGTKYFYPYECFRLVCERLFGQAGCYTQYSADIPVSEFDDPEVEMIVSKIELFRKDGLEVTLTKLGNTLIDTLEDESNSGIHRLHKPHRYNLKFGQKCEDNHAFCTDVIAAFTRDHGRLPVTHMTSEAFHARSSFVFDEELPVMVALVHPENITQSSRFLKSLERVAHQLYQDLVVVTVDVDQYPSWAGRFVPRDYQRSVMISDTDETPSLFIYPRIVFIKWRDHRHAAFYPPVETQVTINKPFKFTTTEIMIFARKFLASRNDMMVETDHF